MNHKRRPHNNKSNKSQSNKEFIFFMMCISILVLIAFAGCTTTEKAPIIKKIIISPIAYCCDNAKCAQAVIGTQNPDGVLFNNISICSPDNFNQHCRNINGVLVKNDLNPIAGVFYECYPISNDSNESCSSDDDCMYYCDFETAIRDHKCTDIMQLKKDDKDYGDKTYYVTTYLCNNPKKPGTCSSGPLSLSNPGGVSITYQMDGNHLIKDESPSATN